MAYSDGSYRLANLIIARSSLTHAAYAVVNFPVQSDQGRWPWFFPTGDSGVYDHEAEISHGLGGYSKGVGEANFVWHLGPMSPGMVTYWVDTIFGGAHSIDCTVMTWDRSYGWRSVYAIVTRGKFSETAVPGGKRGYVSMDITFVVTAEASDFTDEFEPTEFN